MKHTGRSILSIAFLASFLFLPLISWATMDAEEDQQQQFKGHVEVLPVQFAFIEGDYEKFQAHQWAKEDYVGGFDNINISYGDPEKIFSEADGKAIIGNGDYKGSYSIRQKDQWFLHFDFDQFRKYYDGTGGVYHRFGRRSVTELDRELALDIGKFEVEFGITPEKLPDVIFFYEHEYREGAKSRLTWAAVLEGTTTRNISPSWQEIDEQVDVFGLRVEHDVNGYTIKGEQKFELARIESKRYERQLSDNASTATVAARNTRRVRIHDLDPRTDMFSTRLEADKWFMKDKVHASSGFQFAHLDNSEREQLREFDEFLNPACLSGNCENKFDARADNTVNVNTLVMSATVFPIKTLSVGTKVKAEMIGREGESRYPGDTNNPPDFDPNRIELSNVENKVRKIGEGISIRFKGIPRTALYTEFEGEQVYNTITENRTSTGITPSANEIFSRETVVPIWRGIWTAGINSTPIRILNFTNQFRYKRDNNNYDDRRETSPGTNTARSAFFDELDIRSVELTTRATLKPCRWFQGSLRHQLRGINYMTRIENEGQLEPETLSNVFSYDVMIFPIPQVSITGSYIQENFHSESDTITSSVPAFTGDVDTWLFAVAYAVRENLSFDSSASYTRTRNFDDFTDIGLPLGSEFDRVEVTFGFMWKPAKDVSVGPKYAFYHYRSNHKAEIGDYNVNVAGLEASLAWG